MTLKPIHLLAITIVILMSSVWVGIYSFSQKPLTEQTAQATTNSFRNMPDSDSNLESQSSINNLLKLEDHSFIDLVVNKHQIKAEIVNTQASRTLGLSGRASLQKDSGLLFIFNEPGFYSFWMKDMKFSIDMIWIDQFGKIVHIEKDISPKTFPKGFVSVEPAQAVLEVPAGFSDENNVKTGDTIRYILK